MSMPITIIMDKKLMACHHIDSKIFVFFYRKDWNSTGIHVFTCRGNLKPWKIIVVSGICT